MCPFAASASATRRRSAFAVSSRRPLLTGRSPLIKRRMARSSMPTRREAVVTPPSTWTQWAKWSRGSCIDRSLYLFLCCHQRLPQHSCARQPPRRCLVTEGQISVRAGWPGYARKVSGNGQFRRRYSILPIPQIPAARRTSADQAIKLFCQLYSSQRPDFPPRGPFGVAGR